MMSVIKFCVQVGILILFSSEKNFFSEGFIIPRFGQPLLASHTVSNRLGVVRDIPQLQVEHEEHYLNDTTSALHLAKAQPQPIERHNPENTLSDDTNTLWSYVYNIQRARRQLKEGGKQSSWNTSIDRETKNNLLKAARSLSGFLENNRIQFKDDTKASVLLISEPLHRAVIQAFRLASSLNDYKLIMQIVDAVQKYTASEPMVKLEPRIIGEAITGLTQTSVNIGKIKSLWNKCLGTPNDNEVKNCFGTWTALETNVMLQALASRGKVRAALDFYEENKHSRTDSYSISILIKALVDSVSVDDHSDFASPELLDELPGLENAKIFKPWLSKTCWQWNEAVRLIDSVFSSQRLRLNNPIFSALLQLNEKATQAHGQRLQKGPEKAMLVFKFLKEYEIHPDEMTYTLIISNLGEEWRTAVTLLRAATEQENKRQQSRRTLGDSDEVERNGQWELPRPNSHMYSATLAACARSRQFDTAIQLLDELHGDADNQLQCADSEHLKPNTWMYNSIFQALLASTSIRQIMRVSKPAKRGAQHRIKLAFEMLERMQEGAAAGFNTAPDTVTYNTILSLLANTRFYLRKETDWANLSDEFQAYIAIPEERGHRSYREKVVYAILHNMKKNQIQLDFFTYRHAIQVLGGTDRSQILSLFDQAMMENKKWKKRTIDMYNACLSALAESGELESVLSMLTRMVENSIKTNPETTIHIISALGKSTKTEAIPVLLLSLTGDDEAAQILSAVHGIDLPITFMSPLEMCHYSSAISICLKASDFKSAHRVLLLMKNLGIRPSDSSLEEVAKTYAMIALSESSKKTERHTKTGTIVILPGKSAQARARSAYDIIKSIAYPSSRLISIVSRACSSVGLFRESRHLLRLIHKRAIKNLLEAKSHADSFGFSQSIDDDTKILERLHPSLLRCCAEQGNVTNALRLCKDIQSLSTKAAKEDKRKANPSFEDISGDIISTPLSSHMLKTTEVEPTHGIGMKAEEWRLLLVAASKSGHWRVCLTTLQFLRPYIEATHPDLATTEEDRESLSMEYSRMESVLITAIKCLAIRSQYGWIVRAIEDWIDWSGRRPPREAVLVAIRSLSSRGRGEEVNSLVTRCVSMPPPKVKGNDPAYAPMLFVGAISSLHHDGLYDAADDAFVAGMSRDALPLDLKRATFGNETRVTLDLHGMNVAVAHSAVRIALQQEYLRSSWKNTDLCDSDMVIVTGRGHNSALKMRPVLRPEVQRMLLEEFYPPLNTISVPGNMGAIRISYEDISAWLEHQRIQKGARMLAVASMLSSYKDRVRLALARAAITSKLNNN